MIKANIFRISLISLVSLLALPSFALAQSDRGLEARQKHRSSIANVVQELRQLASENKGIGEEVSQIAQAQEEITEEVEEAVSAVENRSPFKTFFLGTDYKNLGHLSSQMVTTQNHINRLSNAMDRAEEDAKDTLQEQIDTLEQTQNNINSFIEENESKFSLFGWLVKFFN